MDETVIKRHKQGEVTDDFDPSDPKQEETRRLAALNMRDDPETKQLAEEIMGVEFCKRRFPEAYPQ